MFFGSIRGSLSSWPITWESAASYTFGSGSSGCLWFGTSMPLSLPAPCVLEVRLLTRLPLDCYTPWRSSNISGRILCDKGWPAFFRGTYGDPDYCGPLLQCRSFCSWDRGVQVGKSPLSPPVDSLLRDFYQAHLEIPGRVPGCICWGGWGNVAYWPVEWAVYCQCWADEAQLQLIVIR